MNRLLSCRLAILAFVLLTLGLSSAPVRAATVRPPFLTNGLVAAATRRGARVHGHSPVTAVERAGEGWLVRTPSASVRARRVVLCTNGHRGNRFFPELAATNYPLLACALTTQPLPEDVLAGINPSRAAFTQFPTGLYPLVIDGRRRLVTATIPDAGAAEDGARSFGRFLRYLHRFFPHTRAADIRLESYWTGETASSSSAYHEDYPKLYAVAPGVTAAMNVGTWGNVFAPQLGTHVADWLVDGRGQDLVLELETPHAVPFQRSFALKTRRVLIPLARLADRLGLD